jgi:hypothetical protein
MNKRMITCLSILFLFLSTPIIPVNAAAKAGTRCAKAGNTEVVKGKSYTCVKSGGKLKWNSGVATSTKIVRDIKATYSTDGGYLDNIIGGPCSPDPLAPTEWLEMQSFTSSINNCAGQVRVAKYNLGNQRPTSTYLPASDFSQVNPCKITYQNSRSGLSHGDQWRMQRRHPGPNSVIQLIPIYAEDTAKPKNSPAQDYSKYLEFMKEWIDYSTDFGSNVQFRIPNEYIKFPNKVEPYKLYHPVNWDTPGHVKFNKDVISTVDPLIDFTGATIGIIVAPAGTDAAIMQQAALGSFQTNEGLVAVGFSQFGDVPSNSRGSNYSGLTHPFWWIHEAYHAGYGLDDHYGDTKNDIATEHGMGWWTMMTPWGGDLSIWEKWLLGFAQDSQFQCVANPKTTTHWIAPSSVRTQESKSVVIPISSTKVVVAESIRPAGLHYKVPQQVQGVLVYEIDLTINEHGLGMKLSLPTNRQVTSYPFFLGGAPLKKGDVTTSNGLTISVIESGTFGDVIKVQKLN